MGIFFIYKKKFIQLIKYLIFPNLSAWPEVPASSSYKVPAPTTQLPAGPSVNILGSLLLSLSNNSIT